MIYSGETLASANEPGTPYRLIVQKQPPHEVEVASLGSFSYGLQDMPGGLQRVQIDYSQERLSNDREYLVQMARDIGKVAIGIEEGATAACGWGRVISLGQQYCSIL